MPKIMLVEDDNNLREIYGERLLAEGYEIVAAGDGEEALSLAVKEKPDLIIADVMMPKISGFDMLDILRQTPETKDTKVIMMTALSQTEDKERADRLGANKYLVKSQVTLEDVARVVHEMVYPDEAKAPASQPNATEPTVTAEEPVAAPPATDTAATEVTAPDTATEPATPPEPATDDTKVVAEPDTAKDTPPSDTAKDAPVVDDKPATPSEEPAQTPADNPITGAPETTEPAPAGLVTDDSSTAATTSEETAAVDKKIEDFVNNNAPAADPSQSTPEVGPPARQILVNTPDSDVPPVISDSDSLEPPSSRKKVIEPPDTSTKEPDINELYKKELADEESNTPAANPDAGSVVDAPASDNPITDDTTQAETTPLETVDASQIPGVTVGEPEVTPQTDEPQPEQTDTTSQKPKETGPDPNQIAL